MTEADIILTPLPQVDGVVKNRPALLLRELPPFGGFLAVLPRQRILGSIGQIASDRHARLLRNLGKHLMANLKEAPNNAKNTDK